MEKKQVTFCTLLGILLLSIFVPFGSTSKSSGVEVLHANAHKERQISIETIDTEKHFRRFTYDSGLKFDYPDAVRGIYVTGNSAGGSRMESLIELVDSTNLNEMVIVIIEDNGNLTFILKKDSLYADIEEPFFDNQKEMIEVIEEIRRYHMSSVIYFNYY